MISGEHVIEAKSGFQPESMAASNVSYEEHWDRQKNSGMAARQPTMSGISNQQRKTNKRESSGVKKTQIEVLDHETPLAEYQQ